MNTISFRSLVIDLLDSSDGIPESTYQKLVHFAYVNYPNICDDVWAATEGGDGNNGYCVYLDEDTANELRNKN
jgi:hypothetical protein